MKNPRPRSATDAAKSGSTDEEALVRNNIGWMLGLAERLVGNKAQAEDVVQEALINALRGLADFEGRSQLKTWLRRITINAAISSLRKQNRLAEQPIDELLPEFDRFDCRIEDRWTQLKSADEVLASSERRTAVLTAVRSLPESYGLVLQLRDIEGYDTAEVAEMLNLSASNVKVRLHRARAALKKLLEPVLRNEDLP